MTVDLVTHALVGLLPVCCFLAALVLMDSYKLVDVRWIVATIALGSLVGGISYFAHDPARGMASVSFSDYTRYFSPFIEEALKGLIIVVLLYRNRIGFLVDAAIFGFAVGAGFALIENLYFLQALQDSPIGVWIVRGFGTAIMHGGTTAILSVSYRALIREESRSGIVAFLPGFLVASIIHSVFNHFFLSPINNAIAILITLPILMAIVYRQSERAVSKWLDVGFDADTELLELINSGKFSTSKVGIYLTDLKENFVGEIVADLLCYLRLYVELSIRAKGLLMMRESGFAAEVDVETTKKLAELKYLEGSIGKTGKLAIKPFLQMSRKDLWQFYVLSK